MRHIPRKRFGQHFLVDTHIIAEIVRIIRPVPGDQMIEIGPGLGALTKPLLNILDKLQVIEIDRDIVSYLSRADTEKLVIHNADTLKFDFSVLGDGLRIVGNLPYNISTPLLFHLAKFSSLIIDMHFMLQLEVVERMVALPSTSDYGRLSVMLQNRFEMEQMLAVSAESFDPPPQVQSAIVWMRPRVEPVIPPDQEKLFGELVLTAFSQRRKTLRNTLRHYLTAEDFNQLEIDSGLRAENLSLEQYSAITRHIHAISQSKV